MSYNTIDKVKQLRIPEVTLIQLTDDTDLGIINDAIATGVIAGGDALIDSYLRGRLVLPLSPVPDLIPELALDIYAYGFYALKPNFEMPKTIAERYTNALATLRLVQKGELKLGAAEIETPAVGGSSAASIGSTRTRVFDDTRMDSY
jgi:phage gp36-like protein